MNFLTLKEKKASIEFLRKGYIIQKIENKNSLKYISNLINKNSKKILKIKKNFDLNNLHKYIEVNCINDFRLKLINIISNDKMVRYHYFNLSREIISILAGNELMMQKNINLSIQMPNDHTSLLPVHSDVWSGDSAYEINLWLPLVNCYKSKSMYILEQKKYNKLKKKFSNLKSSYEIYEKIKKN